jgi:peroxiredoxin
MPYLKHLSETYRRDGWQLWVVTQNDADASRQYAERFGAPFPVLVDEPEDWAVSCAWDPPATPTLFLIDREGRVEAVTWGFSKGDVNEIMNDRPHLGELAMLARPDDGNPDARPG